MMETQTSGFRSVNGKVSINIGNKIYSRKELTEWVEKQNGNVSKSIGNISNRLSVDSLKNGLFFLSILSQIFTQDFQAIKSKINIKPTSEYDFDKNLQMVKKILNKYKMQMNLNVNEIIKNKNCFDFLNWFKNLHDCCLFSSACQAITQKVEKEVSPNKNIQSFNQIQGMHSGYKTNREPSASKNVQQKRLSQSKSNRNYSTSKSENPLVKIKSNKQLIEMQMNNEIVILNNNKKQNTMNVIKNANHANYMSDFDSLDDFTQALYETALEESIESFKKILQNVKNKAVNSQNTQSFGEYVNRVLSGILSIS